MKCAVYNATVAGLNVWLRHAHRETERERERVTHILYVHFVELVLVFVLFISKNWVLTLESKYIRSMRFCVSIFLHSNALFRAFHSFCVLRVILLWLLLLSLQYINTVLSRILQTHPTILVFCILSTLVLCAFLSTFQRISIFVFCITFIDNCCFFFIFILFRSQKTHYKITVAEYRTEWCHRWH